MREITDDIIEKAALGDEASFEEIYRAYSRFVYNVALRMVREPQAAEEVTQDVFLVMFRKLKTFQYKSSLKTWIYRITINMSINHAKRSHNKNREIYAYDDARYVSSEGNQIFQDVDKEYHENVIRKLLDLLNPDQRACIVLRNIEGLSYEEIARSLHININTVRSRLKRAREKLLSLRKEVIHNEM